MKRRIACLLAVAAIIGISAVTCPSLMLRKRPWTRPGPQATDAGTDAGAGNPTRADTQPTAGSTGAIRWSDVRPEIAYFCGAVSREAVDHRPYRRARTWADLISGLVREELFGADPAATERDLRAAGLVLSIDFAIARLAGFEPKRVRFHPQRYFPLMFESSVLHGQS